MLLREGNRSTEHDHTTALLIVIAVGVSTYLLRVVLKMLCVISANAVANVPVPVPKI